MFEKTPEEIEAAARSSAQQDVEQAEWKEKQDTEEAEKKRKEEEVKAREAAWVAYDNLPWYRKLWTKCPAF